MISVYLLLDLCLCPCLCPSLCLSLPPAQTPARPASRPSPVPDLPVRFPCPALPGDGNGRKCRPSVRRGTVGRRIVAEVFPGRAEIHHRATDSGRNVPRACGAAPLGDGNERKCCPGVLRYTIGRRIVAEIFPERAARHRWATETSVSVARACYAAPLGYG